jgi:putative transposase
MVFHVMNRSVGGATLFKTDADYAAFEQILAEGVKRFDMRLLAYCFMPNHFHEVIWPRRDGDVSEFMRWLTVTHSNRWHAWHGTTGWGHLYQGRFKSFPIETDRYLLVLWRYVERNALRAGLVNRARQWRWSSLCARLQGPPELRAMLSDGPIDLPPDWEELVDQPQTAAEVEAIRQSIVRGRPLGDAAWSARIARRLELESSLRTVGRPKKVSGTILAP